MRNTGIIDVRCPIEWNHPLNRGLLNSWIGLPNSGWSGGSVIRDCVRGAKLPVDATLSGGAAWRSAPNGFRGLSVAGANKFASASLVLGTAALTGLGSASVPDFTVGFYGSITGEGTGSARSLLMHHTGSFGNQFAIEIDGSNFVVFRYDTNRTGAVAVPTDTDFVFMFAKSGTSAPWYKNGLVQETFSVAASVTGDDTQSKVTVSMPGSATFPAARVYAYSIWNCGLSAAEAAAWSVQAKSDLPDTLRRVSNRVWSSGATSPPPPPTDSFKVISGQGGGRFIRGAPAMAY